MAMTKKMLEAMLSLPEATAEIADALVVSFCAQSLGRSFIMDTPTGQLADQKGGVTPRNQKDQCRARQKVELLQQ